MIHYPNYIQYVQTCTMLNVLISTKGRVSLAIEEKKAEEEAAGAEVTEVTGM